MSKEKTPDQARKVERPASGGTAERPGKQVVAVWPEIYAAIESLRGAHESRTSVVARAVTLLVKTSDCQVPVLIRKRLGLK